MRARLPGGWLVAALLTAILAAPAFAQDNPIVASVKSRLKDPDKPFTLIVQIKVKEGAGERFEAAFAKARRATRQEKGNLAYDLSRDTQDPSRYLVYERWKNLEALEAHLQTAYIKALLAELPEFSAGPPESRVLLPAGE
jgi:quinol monooxygenase YgiN